MATKKTVSKNVPKKSVRAAPERVAVRAAPVQRKSMGLAVLGLFVNIFIPGAGSMIGGNVPHGIWQLVLAILGFLGLKIIPIIGVILYLAGWVWALVTSIQNIRRAQ